MGRLIVVEGLDGAGKRTLADGVDKALRTAGATVGRFAFPRYGRSDAAELVRDALYGQAGGLSGSVHGMAVLYAMDRAGARDELLQALASHDIVLLDRYIASNAAYGAARLRQGGTGEFVAWVQRTEVQRLRLPVPAVQLLLRVPAAVAAERARRRAETDSTRTRDEFESDAELQARVAQVYDELAALGWLSPWQVLPGDVDHTVLAGQLLD